MKTVTENYTWLHYGRRVAGHLQEAIEGVEPGGKASCGLIQPNLKPQQSPGCPI